MRKLNEVCPGPPLPATQLVCTMSQDSKTVGYVVIDSMVGGRSRGGLRMLPDISEAEMRCVARSMTLKYGFLGLPQGGAKAGVLGDPEAPLMERRSLLRNFGRAFSPLLKSRAYIPDTDMGTTNSEIQDMLQSVGITTKKREFRGAYSGYYTALTTLAGVKRASAHLGVSLSGATVAIEGFGKVGGALAELLTAEGARVVAVSTSRGAVYSEKGLDVPRLKELSEREGSRLVDRCPDADRISPAQLLELPVDMICPCARHDSINEDNAASVKARILCPGANNAVTPGAERMLMERGVLSMPDFVTNCGGVLGGTMEFASVGIPRIREFIDRHVGERIAWILSEARRCDVPPRETATRLALCNLERMRRRAETPSTAGWMFNLALEAYRRGGIPGSIVARLSLPYFEKCLAK